MKSNLAIILLILATIVVSCKTSFEVQVYQFLPSLVSDIYNENENREKILRCNEKGITLKNDSIFEYWKIFGGLGSVTTVKYHIKGNLLVLDSLDIYGRPFSEEFTNIKFIYSIDSLINNRTNEKYYNQKFLKWKYKK